MNVCRYSATKAQEVFDLVTWARDMLALASHEPGSKHAELLATANTLLWKEEDHDNQS